MSNISSSEVGSVGIRLDGKKDILYIFTLVDSSVKNVFLGACAPSFDPYAALSTVTSIFSNTIQQKEINEYTTRVMDKFEDPLTQPDPVYSNDTVNQQKYRVYRSWLKRAYFESDPKYLIHLLDFIDWLLTTYTVPQIKSYLELNDTQWVKVSSRYLNISNNITVYQSDTYGDID